MLIRNKEANAVGLGYHPRLLQGPMSLPAGNALAAASTPYTQGIYMRPNQGNQGTIPAGAPLCSCPDIWIAGLNPVANFQTALATSQSYATQSANTITKGGPNYIYVRGKNGSTIPRTTKVMLYGLPCAVIQWPAEWAKYAIPTDIDHPDGKPPIYDSSIVNLAAGSIGVAANTFVWANPQNPPAGSDHYCLITWLDNDSNPFPNVFSQLDMSALVTNNLQFGWRNVGLADGTAPTVQISTQLIIPDDVTPGSREYSLQVTNSGFPPNTDNTGWTISLSCSQTDDKGNPITINNAAMPDINRFIGVRCWLSPGYSATITVNLYRNRGPAAPSTASLEVEPAYYSDGSSKELQEALDRGLVDFALSHAVHQAYRGTSANGIRPRPLVLLGADGVRIK